ncbi:MAG: diguanylate cyclase [Candidatus Brocadiaceae bacterium]|nr:diguanylate cyclase [Candidatus Brocadiaceae bacterium]
MKFLEIFEKQSKPFFVLVGFALIGFIGIIDFLIGYEIALSVFYVLPIALVTWFTNRRLGLVISLTSAFVWLWADAATGHSYTHHLIPIWNTLIRLAFFLIITFLLSTVRRATERERKAARTDHLTGAMNSRFFYDLSKKEIDRFQRYKHPFTLAYIDLDNFKTVNDHFGHPIGDQVLRRVVSSARKHLRKTDVVARLGGDEFALLLPETNEESARVAISKIQDSLLEEMRLGKWPITFSIGVLTCNATPHTIEELVRIADELMYSVKRDGKNEIKYSSYAG